MTLRCDGSSVAVRAVDLEPEPMQFWMIGAGAKNV